MDRAAIRKKTKQYIENEGFVLPKDVFRDFFSHLIKLAGFGLGGMFIIPGKKAGKKAAENFKAILGDNLDKETIKECIIAYFEESRQCYFEQFDLNDNKATIKLKHSVFAEGIKSRKPTCLPLGGTITGMLEEFLDSTWQPKEKECITQGKEACIFEIVKSR